MKGLHIALDRFDRIILGVLVVLGLIVGALALAISLRGAAVVSTLPVEGGVIGSYGEIQIEFAQEMQVATTQAAFTIEPLVTGTFHWEGMSLWFKPDQAFRPGVAYVAHLGTGATSRDGRRVRKEITWHFKVRSPEVAYLKLVNGETGEVWRQSEGGGEGRQLTRTDGKVSGYGVSVDGEWIAYSAGNGSGGIDLWLVDRQGGSARLLVECGKDWCTAPAWSPDSKRIAYSREGTGGEGGSANGIPRIYTVEVSSGKSAPLYTDNTITGTEPAWSPDGTRLAFYDLGAGGIRVLDLETSKESIIKTSMQDTGSWSSDGSQLLYALPQVINEILVVSIYQLNLGTGEGKPVLGQDNLGQIDYGLPAWSPDGEWVAVGIRLAGTTESRQLLLERLDGTQPQEITKTPVYNYAAYRWDPWGTALVFQRFPQGQSGGEPDVGVWDRATGNMTILAENSAMPEWMP